MYQTYRGIGDDGTASFNLSASQSLDYSGEQSNGQKRKEKMGGPDKSQEAESKQSKEGEVIPKVDATPQFPTIENPTVAIDYKKEDYRTFVFAVHPEYGLALLYCTRKEEKGPHYQLPGGHIDESEFLNAARTSNDATTQLLLAAQMGVARELWEETGIDVRNQLHRLEPAELRSEMGVDSNGESVLACELEKRIYFFLNVDDDDFIKVRQW